MNKPLSPVPLTRQITPEYMLPGELPPVLPLIQNLCDELSREGINYCHWKSNNAIDRSANGVNDLDLLVERSEGSRFSELLFQLGFKQAKASPEKEAPGIQDFFGYDCDSGRLVHVHAHFQLILGHDMTKSFRLPIEKAYLASASQGDHFRIPAPEFEFVVFVIRMILKHSTWDTILAREAGLNKSERQELKYLSEMVDKNQVYEVLIQHLPYIEPDLFDHCVEALRPGCPLWRRIRAGQKLQSSLQALSRRPLAADIFLKQWRRTILAFRWRLYKSSKKRTLIQGGATIAIVGGDGAGKSTAVDGLQRWLSKDFDVIKAHLGKPAWSITTIFIRSILKIGQILGFYPLEVPFKETIGQNSLVSPGYPFLIREACRARDRYRTYLKVRRFAASGGFVLFDRFPVDQVQLMDGPQTARLIKALKNKPAGRGFLIPHEESWLAKMLVRIEESYYRKIVLPEILIVIRLDPEIAVQRKTEEKPDIVRERSLEILSADWQGTNANVIDGSRPQAEVLADIKAYIWSQL